MPALTEEDLTLTDLVRIEGRISEMASRIAAARKRMKIHGIDSTTVDGASSRAKGLKFIEFFLASLDRAITADIEGIDLKAKRISEPIRREKPAARPAAMKAAARPAAKRK